jgi:hypothetical protein
MEESRHGLAVAACLRIGLAHKVSRFKLGYALIFEWSRAVQGRGMAASYDVAVGPYATAGIFLIAMCLISLTPLFAGSRSLMGCSRHSAPSAACR